MSQPAPRSVFEESPKTLIEEHRGVYLIVNSVSRRVKELQRGAKKLAFPPDGSMELERIALQELLEEKLTVVERVPLTEEEVRAALELGPAEDDGEEL